MFYLDGPFKPLVYVAPSHETVIVRYGENARGRAESALANSELNGATGR